MRVRLQDLKETDSEAQELRQQGQEGYKEIDGMLHYQGLSFVPKAMRIELINYYHNDPLTGHFGIEKICELLAWKYYWPTPRHDNNAYVKGCDVCLALKTVRYKPYGDLQSMPVPIHW